MQALKAFVAIFIGSCSISLLAQNQPATPWAACGDMNAGFSVDRVKEQPSIPPADPAKARIVFIEDSDGEARVGIGGQWAGALKGTSYFFVAVDPGEQHLCAAAGDGHVALAHLTAEAGKTYFYRVRIWFDPTGARIDPIDYIDLSPIDSDEAAFQIQMFPLAIARPRK
jgi:hypothetical protein